MRHKSQIFVTASLHLEGLLRRESLNGQSDRLIEHSIQDVKCFPIQTKPMTLRQLVDTTSEDIVFRNYLDDVKAILVSFEAVDGRTSLEEGLRNCLVLDVLKCLRQLIEQGGNMIVERRNIEMFC